MTSEQVEPIWEELRKIRWLLHHDVLTGLPNKLSFERHLTEVDDGWFLLVDLDGFKDYQDARQSHHAGDLVLREFATAMQRIATEVVGNPLEVFAVRLHGDEFAVWTLDEAMALEIKHRLEAWENHDGGVTASVGSGFSMDAAERAMYAKKARKRRRRTDWLPSAAP